MKVSFRDMLLQAVLTAVISTIILITTYILIDFIVYQSSGSAPHFDVRTVHEMTENKYTFTVTAKTDTGQIDTVHKSTIRFESIATVTPSTYTFTELYEGKHIFHVSNGLAEGKYEIIASDVKFPHIKGGRYSSLCIRTNTI